MCVFLYVFLKAQLLTFNRCTCANCAAMASEPENVCCMEIPQVTFLIASLSSLFREYIFHMSFNMFITLGVKTDAGTWALCALYGGPSWFGACVTKCVLPAECFQYIQSWTWETTDEANTAVSGLFVLTEIVKRLLILFMKINTDVYGFMQSFISFCHCTWRYYYDILHSNGITHPCVRQKKSTHTTLCFWKQHILYPSKHE